MKKGIVLTEAGRFWFDLYEPTGMRRAHSGTGGYWCIGKRRGRRIEFFTLSLDETVRFVATGEVPR